MVASDFCLTDQGLYFINRMDSDCVYLCGRDGIGSLKISNEPALSVDYDGKEVTMILKSDMEKVVFEPWRYGSAEHPSKRRSFKFNAEGEDGNFLRSNQGWIFDNKELSKAGTP